MAWHDMSIGLIYTAVALLWFVPVRCDSWLVAKRRDGISRTSWATWTVYSYKCYKAEEAVVVRGSVKVPCPDRTPCKPIPAVQCSASNPSWSTNPVPYGVLEVLEVVEVVESIT